MKPELRFSFALILVFAGSALAAESSNSPYIDAIRSQLPEKASGPSYTEEMQKKLKTGESGSSYMESLKKVDPERFQAPKQGGYIDQQRSGLESKEIGGAISAFREGRSALKPRYKDEIHYAFGMRYGVGINRSLNATADAMARSFDAIYGANYAPDFSVFYEWQPFHSETFGNLGLITQGGVAAFRGFGTFGVTLPVPAGVGSGNFSETSRTKFQFFTLPLNLGAIYRFNLSHYLRPFVSGGPMIMGYMERRDDGQGTDYQGFSLGYQATGGVSFLLDWLSKSAAWDQYANYGIRHSYLTVEYIRQTTLSGDVEFGITGVLAGLAFEY